MKAPLLALALSLFAGLAHGQERMSDDELDANRGGLMTPWGMEIGFGAVVRTYVDGTLALQSQVTWTPEGVSRTYDVGAPTADLAELAAANGLKVAPGSEGLLIDGVGGGATVVLHDLSAERIAGLVLNNADNRDIRQNADITLTVPQLEAMQRNLTSQALSARLQESVSQALRDAAIR